MNFARGVMIGLPLSLALWAILAVIWGGGGVAVSDYGDQPRVAQCGCEPWDSYDLHSDGCKYAELEAENQRLQAEQAVWEKQVALLKREAREAVETNVFVAAFAEKLKEFGTIERLIETYSASKMECRRLEQELQQEKRAYEILQVMWKARLEQCNAALSAPTPHLEKSIEALIAELQAANLAHERTLNNIGNLLARIFRDGGHHAFAVGTDLAIQQAEASVSAWLTMQDEFQQLKQSHEQYREWAAEQVRRAKAALREAEYLLRDSEHLDARIERYFEAKKKP